MRPGFTHIKNCVAVGRAVASDDIIGARVQIWSLEIWTNIFCLLTVPEKTKRRKRLGKERTIYHVFTFLR